MGIIDVSLNRNSTILTVSHMDSTIKLYPIDSCNSISMQGNPRTSNVASWKTGKYTPFRKTLSLVEK
jgi:hypothetical protein